MNYLVLMRHGQSEWNKQNLFTGFKDVDLTEEGIAEAHKAGPLEARGRARFVEQVVEVEGRAAR